MSNNLNFAKISSFNERIQRIVDGFVRESQKLLTQNSSFYIIPDLVINVCVLYYFMPDEFDKECIGFDMSLDDQTQTITMQNDKSNSAFLTNIAKNGTNHWKFRINRCANNLSWSCSIGIWRIKQEDYPDILPINSYFSSVLYSRNESYPRAYGFAYNIGERIRCHIGYPCDMAMETPLEFKYGIKCRTNDIIDMYCDLDKCELRFSINNKDYGTLFQIKKAYYRAVINLLHKHDSVSLLNYYL